MKGNADTAPQNMLRFHQCLHCCLTYTAFKINFACSDAIIRSVEISESHTDTWVLLSSSCKWCRPACWAQKRRDWKGKIREVISCHRFVSFCMYILGSCFAFTRPFLVREAEMVMHFSEAIVGSVVPIGLVSFEESAFWNGEFSALKFCRWLQRMWIQEFGAWGYPLDESVHSLVWVDGLAVSNEWEPLYVVRLVAWFMLEFCVLSHRRVI